MNKIDIKNCDIKDLLAYYESCGHIINYYENIYRANDGTYDFETKFRMNEAKNKVSSFFEKKDAIMKEMEKRIETL